jgi:hypothetical protein
VVADELEGIVALFSEVLLDYRVSPEEILRYEGAIRSGSYAALEAKEPIVPCALGADCLSMRTVGIRAGAAVAGRAWEELRLEGLGLRLVSLRRQGIEIAERDRQKLLPGDEVTIEASAAAFAEAKPFFAVSGLKAAPSHPEPQRAAWIDTGQRVDLVVRDGGGACSHLGDIRDVYPSAMGCEDCLRTGDRWVHLRVCMICGHMGCCDSSPNRHATKHYETTSHPIMRSMERDESWGWCFVDEVQLS